MISDKKELYILFVQFGNTKNILKYYNYLSAECIDKKILET